MDLYFCKLNWLTGLVQLRSILEAWKILVLPGSWKYRMPHGGASSKLVWFVCRSDIYPAWIASPRRNAFGTHFLETPCFFLSSLCAVWTPYPVISYLHLCLGAFCQWWGCSGTPTTLQSPAVTPDWPGAVLAQNLLWWVSFSSGRKQACPL